MSEKSRRIAMLVLPALVVFAVSLASAQTPALAADDKGLLPMIPPDAVFFLEHRGHTAVRDAFEASNLGKMYKDEVITQFVQDSRVQFGKMIMKQMFDSPALKTDPAELQQTLHKVLKPFWYNPAAMYVVLTDGKTEEPPGVGFICAMDEKSRAEAKPALESLMQIGVPSAGMGTRQAFKWKTDKLEWNGVAKAYNEFALSATPDKQAGELKDKSLFMTCWTDKHLLVATSLSAAASMGKAMAKPDANKDKSESLARILKKTAQKDWAFRWYVDGDALRKAMPKDGGEGPMGGMMMTSLGLPRIHGAGGTGGFTDNVYTRLSYIDAPGATEGVMGIIKPGGTYKTGLAMMPRQTTFVLAGQIDTAKTVAIIRSIALAAAKAKAHEEAPPPKEEDLKGGATSKPAAEPEPKLDETASKVIAQLEQLAGASGGNGGIYLTDLAGLFAGMMGGSGAPVGMVLDIKDKAKATAAIEQLINLSGGTMEGRAPAADGPPPNGQPAQPTEYRKVAIRRLSEMFRLGILEDRVVLAMSDDAFKSAVDAALDKTGGFDPEGAGAKMLQLCGQGSAMFSMDLAALAKLGWPIISTFVEQNKSADFPLASLPSTEKLVGFLGPEVAVFQPDDGGLLIKSRGKIPFATKILGTYPTLGWLFYVGFSSSRHVVRETMPPMPPPPLPPQQTPGP